MSSSTGVERWVRWVTVIMVVADNDDLLGSHSVTVSFTILGASSFKLQVSSFRRTINELICKNVHMSVSFIYLYDYSSKCCCQRCN